MGLAKEKMFGKKRGKWPHLQKLVEQGHLLEIDLAYAQMQTEDEKEGEKIASLIAKARAGEIVDLPRHQYFQDQIRANIDRLLQGRSTSDGSVSQLLNDEQKKAVETALNSPLSIITGGPGTGKTFTAAEIVKAFNTKTILSAPTGKAAAHLESKLDGTIVSKTLHSLLKVYSPLSYYKPVEELDAHLIIVDECSMIEPPLFGRLLSAISTNAHLVLMGDVNQLPAVEGGKVFADLINSQKIPTTTLKTCMRSDRVEILELAQSVLDETAKNLRTIDLGFREKSIETIYQKLWNFVRDKDFDHFRILSTLRKGPLGVDALNRFLFEKFSLLKNRFPIMITRNDPKTELYNGDTGVLENNVGTFSNGKQLSIHQLPPFEYAYCISVHKSQGSEYDHVLFLMPEGSDSFGKEVIYTAITRAKEKVDIDGYLF